MDLSVNEKAGKNKGGKVARFRKACGEIGLSKLFVNNGGDSACRERKSREREREKERMRQKGKER